MRVKINIGGFTGRIGDVISDRVIGPIGKRRVLFTVKIDGVGFIEVPAESTIDLKKKLLAARGLVDMIQEEIDSHYHDHPLHGWSVRPDRGGPRLRQLRQWLADANRELIGAERDMGIPLRIASGLGEVMNAVSSTFDIPRFKS